MNGKPVWNTPRTLTHLPIKSACAPMPAYLPTVMKPFIPSPHKSAITKRKIAEHPDWEYAGVFSDRGITGTKENRPGFQAMLEACRKGEIDIVLAKSITRFARNTVILLETVREFRGLGIDIFTVCSPDRHDKQRLRNSHLNGGFLEHSIAYSVVLLPGLVQRGNRNTRFLRLLFGQQKICRRFSSIESGECVKSWPILHEDRIV